MVFLSEMKPERIGLKVFKASWNTLKVSWFQAMVGVGAWRCYGKKVLMCISRVILTHISMSRFMIVQHQPRGVQLGFMGNPTQQKDLCRGSY